MITIRGLTKRFGSLDVLRGIDLEIRPGRITAVIGPNGAGKTTLIKSVLGLTRADGGEIAIDGARVNGDESYRARVGYMPQIARFPENLSAAELFSMLTDLRGATAGPLDEELLERFAIGDQLDKPLRTLSGGTRQKVNAVAAFLFRPPLVILDEPTAGLDPVASAILKDKILAERSHGVTFVLTSHIMSEVEELADDMAFVLDGVVRYAGRVGDLMRHSGENNLERAVASLMVRRVAA